MQTPNWDTAIARALTRKQNSLHHHTEPSTWSWSCYFQVNKFHYVAWGKRSEYFLPPLHVGRVIRGTTQFQRHNPRARSEHLHSVSSFFCTSFQALSLCLLLCGSSHQARPAACFLSCFLSRNLLMPLYLPANLLLTPRLLSSSEEMHKYSFWTADAR